MKATASVEVERPVDEVFAFVTDVSKMPRWVTGVAGARLVSDQMGPDAHFVVDYMGGWRTTELEVAVTDYTPPHLFGLRTERGPFGFEGYMQLEETSAGGTRITNIIEAGPDSVASRVASVVFAPILRRSMPRRLLGELEKLRTAIEGPATADT